MNSMLMLCDAAPAAAQPAGGGMSMMIPMLLILSLIHI